MDYENHSEAIRKTQMAFYKGSDIVMVNEVFLSLYSS